MNVASVPAARATPESGGEPNRGCIPQIQTAPARPILSIRISVFQAAGRATFLAVAASRSASQRTRAFQSIMGGSFFSKSGDCRKFAFGFTAAFIIGLVILKTAAIIA